MVQILPIHNSFTRWPLKTILECVHGVVAKAVSTVVSFPNPLDAVILVQPVQLKLEKLTIDVDGVHAPIQLSFFCGWWVAGKKRCKKEKYWRTNDTAAGTEQPCCQSLMLDTCAQMTARYFEVL